MQTRIQIKSEWLRLHIMHMKTSFINAGYSPRLKHWAYFRSVDFLVINQRPTWPRQSFSWYDRNPVIQCDGLLIAWYIINHLRFSYLMSKLNWYISTTLKSVVRSSILAATSRRRREEAVYWIKRKDRRLKDTAECYSEFYFRILFDVVKWKLSLTWISSYCSGRYYALCTN